MSKCKHKTTLALWTDDDSSRIKTYECVSCDAVGVEAMGESNDEPTVVQEEIEACAVADNPILVCHRRGRYSVYNGGWRAHMDDLDPPISAGTSWRAGWLGRELSCVDQTTTEPSGHDDGAWTWDPAKPIAEQQPCVTHPDSGRYIDGECAECQFERVVDEPTVEAAAEMFGDRDAEVTAFDAANPPCADCEAPFGCDPGQCIRQERETRTEASDAQQRESRQLALARGSDIGPREYELLRDAEPDCRDDDDEVDPATKFGEMARQVTVQVSERFDTTDEVLPDEEAR